MPLRPLLSRLALAAPSGLARARRFLAGLALPGRILAGALVLLLVSFGRDVLWLERCARGLS